MDTGNKSMGSALAQLGEFGKSLSMRQRMLLGGGAVLVGLTLFVFVRLIGKPEMKPLYSGMNPAEAQALGARLGEKNVRFEMSPDGTSVSVPADQLDASRLELAQQGMPHSGRLGFELFDKPNWGGSDFSEKVNYQRALEGELERTIQTMSDVEAVRVHLVMPASSVFTEREREAKAAVILKLRSGRLPETSQLGIARLVASSVDKLKAENVTVVDADTNRPLNAEALAGVSAGMQLDEQLAARLVKTLEPVVGAQRVRASVKLEYDLSTSEESQESYDPSSAVALTMQRSEERSGTGTTSGVAGTASNVPSATGTAAKVGNDEGSQSSKSESGTYAVNRITKHTMLPAGRLKRIATALLVDDIVELKDENGKRSENRRKRTNDEMKQIEDLAKAAIGFDESRGDVVSVQNLSFQSMPLEVPPAPSAHQKVRTILNNWSPALRYASLASLFLMMYLLMLRPLKKQLMTSFRELPARMAAAKIAAKTGQATNVISAETDGELLDTSAPAEVKRVAALKRQLTERVKAEPAATSRLVQTWIREGGLE
ncbi:MAG TPA: flagellar basal-body MS-ring/collar protein FliF [Clostridia bacterium]|nr:flagellar basal-body MS-ring/collar protein FliF [Clostridia bacterium]